MRFQISKEKFRRLLCCFSSKRKKPDSRRRIIRANDSVFNANFHYANNHISTSKYNVFTFLPKNLFEQFQRVANLYFLFLLFLQLMPVISSLSPLTTILPLGFVLLITAVKDASDDLQRCKSDNEVNKRPTWVLRCGKLVKQSWDSVNVGDIIQLRNNDFVTADLFIVSTSEASGLCYIETAELDGETNLKVKQALDVTAGFVDNLRLLSRFDGIIECEPPNNNLNKFEGVLKYNGSTYPLNNDCLLLRGCRVRNTKWCFGVVVYAGNDTKLMRNSGKPVFKRTAIDKILNTIILRIFIFLVTVCLICMVGCILFEATIGYEFTIYLPWVSLMANRGKAGGAVVNGLLQFWSYIIVLNTVVPISLYVSMEIIRLVQSKWIDWDLGMYCSKENIPAVSRTTTLNEELGRIKYVFSDKTGTLTKNIMTFSQCSINGIVYGGDKSETTSENGGLTEDNTPNQDNETVFVDSTATEDNSRNNPNSFQWSDNRLIDALRSRDPKVIEFFTALAICHTVMVENDTGTIHYQAQSPDEEALVNAARYFGIVFLSRTMNTITLSEQGRKVVYKVLNILDFNNERKRMSIIVRDPVSGQIKLYCKGADNKIKERLSRKCMALWAVTEEQLNGFAIDGLRTLCVAYKIINEREYKTWKVNYDKAATSLDDRENKLAAVYEQIEQDLELLGATAIEDELQDGVPATIATMIKASIKVWVLTGDKMETAVNIGLSCRLLSNGMDLQALDEEGLDTVMAKMLFIREYMEAKIREVYQFYDELQWDWEWLEKTLGDKINSPSDKTFEGFALVVAGQTLVYALSADAEALFVDIASMCKSVICCRVTPLQKSQVVDVIRRRKNATTLAVGDGANDVSMIQRAHVGIGISGKEGRQAVLASDYSIGQFRFLINLLFVHGRWSYFRICKFLCYFFYKNFAFTLCNFWYGFMTGFSAQTLFDPFYIATYNVFFTSLPVLALAVFDQDINAENSRRFPQLYKPGQTDDFFNFQIFVLSVLHGIVSSLAVFWVPYFCFRESTSSTGLDISDNQSFGFAVAMILTIVVNLQIALDTYYWTGINHFFIWGTIVFCFLFHFALYSTIIWAIFKVGYYYVGVARVVLSDPRFWLACILTSVVCLFPVYTGRLYVRSFRPSLTDEARYRQKFGMIIRPKEVKLKKKLKINRRWFKSGYAFSHSEGFGHLINAGIMIKKVFAGSDQRKDLKTGDNAGFATTLSSSVVSSEQMVSARSSPVGKSDSSFDMRNDTTEQTPQVQFLPDDKRNEEWHQSAEL